MALSMAMVIDFDFGFALAEMFEVAGGAGREGGRLEEEEARGGGGRA